MAEGNLYQEKKKSTTIYVPQQEQEIRRQQEQEIRQQRQQQRQEAPAAPRQTLRQPMSQQSPLLRETVKRSRERTIIMPEISANVHEEQGPELSLSRTRVERMMEESERKIAIQDKLRDSVKMVRRDKREGRRRRVQHLDMDQAMKLSDSRLAERAGLFDGPRDYLLARYRLIKNEYYTVVPEQSVKKLTNEELADRLATLEKQEERNEELIRYYQSLVSIRKMEAGQDGAAEQKSAKKRTKRAKQ